MEQIKEASVAGLSQSCSVESFFKQFDLEPSDTNNNNKNNSNNNYNNSDIHCKRRTMAITDENYEKEKRIGTNAAL